MHCLRQSHMMIPGRIAITRRANNQLRLRQIKVD